MKIFQSSSRPLQERLIDAESKLGGTLFSNTTSQPAGRRFWYFEGEWFFEQYYENAGYQVIRYQIFENSIHKLFNGREYPFSPGEEETLLQAIRRYHSLVMNQLYGPTKTRHK